MKLKVKITIFFVFLLFIIFLLFNFNFMGAMIQEADSYSFSNELHWTHMPITYSIENCENPENIIRALSLIESQTDSHVNFEESSNPDIKFFCFKIEDCYQNKTERRWIFWTAEIQEFCKYESGNARITEIRGKKILKAEINFAETGKVDDCSETQIHEILHVLNFQHSQDSGSIMYPEKSITQCNEAIDKETIDKIELLYPF